MEIRVYHVNHIQELNKVTLSVKLIDVEPDRFFNTMDIVRLVMTIYRFQTMVESVNNQDVNQEKLLKGMEFVDSALVDK